MSASDMNQICAVDGGGTGCRATIFRSDGAILAHGIGGPANYTTDTEQAIGNVLNAVRGAVEQLGHTRVRLKQMIAHVGLAGIMNEADATALTSRLPFAVCRVTDDRTPTVIGALGDEDGALLAVGTGTFVAARRNGAIRFLGGWGPEIGDQASGAWLGRELLSQTMLASDGLEPKSDLTVAVLSRFDGSPSDVVAFAKQARPADYASFAPQIVSAAQSGDIVGRRLMQRGAAYLNKALDQCDLSDNHIICLTGGVGPHYETHLAPQYRDSVHSPKGNAMDGALLLARKQQDELETST